MKYETETDLEIIRDRDCPCNKRWGLTLSGVIFTSSRFSMLRRRMRDCCSVKALTVSSELYNKHSSNYQPDGIRPYLFPTYQLLCNSSVFSTALLVQIDCVQSVNTTMNMTEKFFNKFCMKIAHNTEETTKYTCTVL